ncbi:hypothetical protein E05_50610 [Plautia stali symbiont]|nr:hypothetical protein E05_50610 [Plautia stali symbiont]
MVVLKEMPAAEIDADATALLSAAIVDVLGEQGLLAAKTTPGSEDFFYYPVKNPQVKAGFWGWEPIWCRDCTIRRCALS